MSKIKILSSLIFMACLLSFSVLWVGVFPHWNIATQSVIRLYDSPALNEASISLPNRTVLLGQISVIDSHEDPSTTVRESGTVTSPSSALPDQGKYSAEVPLSQTDEGKPLTAETLSSAEENLTKLEEGLHN